MFSFSLGLMYFSVNKKDASYNMMGICMWEDLRSSEYVTYGNKRTLKS